MMSHLGQHKESVQGTIISAVVIIQVCVLHPLMNFNVPTTRKSSDWDTLCHMIIVAFLC